MKYALIPLLACLAGPFHLTALPANDEPVLSETQQAIAKVVPSYVRILGGSGVVISHEGRMLTNHHVIQQMYDQGERVFPVVINNRPYQADLLGIVARGDLALLQIQLADGETLPYAELADSDQLKVGQTVIAIGNPFSTMGRTGDPSVSTGIISLLHKNAGGYSSAIITDAAVNPGNSGGPLLTKDGKLAGINGQIRSRTGARANTGIGLAIPANQIARFLPELEKANGENVLHGFLRGVRFDTEEADGLFNGAEISSVVENSNAAAAGLQAGDRIVEAGGLPIHNSVRLRGLLRSYPEGAEVAISYIRGDDTKTTTATLAPLQLGALGIVLEEPEGADAIRAFQRQVRLNPNALIPVVVKEVNEDMPVAESGLQPGDIILKMGDTEIRNIRFYNFAWRRLAAEEAFFAGDQIDVLVQREEEQIAITVTLGQRP